MGRRTFSYWTITLSVLGLLAASSCASNSTSQKDEAQRASLTEADEQAAEDEEQGTEQSEQPGSEDAAADTRTSGASSSAGTDGPDDDGGLPVVATGTVAVVDGHEIGADAFNERIERRTQGNRRVPHRIAVVYKERTVQQLIDEYLLGTKLDAESVTVSDERVEAEYKSFVERFPNDEAFQKFLERAGATPERVKADLRKGERLKKYVAEKYGVDVTEEDARRYYNENSERFDRPERVKASHILIKTQGEGEDLEALERARELSERARGGADFAKLAAEHSEGPSAKRGGDLGFFPKGRMVKPFDEAVFAMQVGDISDPVKTRFGYHVIKLVERKPAGKEPFEDVKDGLIEQIEQRKYRDATETFVAELREQANIERQPENIEIRVPKPSASAEQQSQRGIPPEVLEKLKKQMKEKREQQED